MNNLAHECLSNFLKYIHIQYRMTINVAFLKILGLNIHANVKHSMLHKGREKILDRAAPYIPHNTPKQVFTSNPYRGY